MFRGLVVYFEYRQKLKLLDHYNCQVFDMYWKGC